MKIAVVGKGGSGKSTISSLILSYLTHKKKQFWAIDADTNMHLGLNFGLTYASQKALCAEHNTDLIKQYLIGTNDRIKSADYMVKTTPPGRNSTLIKTPNDEFMKEFSIGQIENGNFFYVGGYSAEGAGLSCYHTSLAILENILSHVNFDDAYCVVDMVASTDTFSNTLHLQFDRIVLLVEPTKESVDLAKKYLELAKSVGVDNMIQIFGNKIADDDDILYIKKELHIANFPFLKLDQDLKKHLRNDQTILSYFEQHTEDFSEVFSFVEKIKKIPFKAKLQSLATLHKKYAQLDYIKIPLGDITDQIDDDFINQQ